MITNSTYLLGLTIVRSGVIPYAIVNGDILFLLAKDRITGELGDFGGGAKHREKALYTTMREFEEESRGIFKQEYDSIEKYKNMISIVSRNMAITFVPVDLKWRSEAHRSFMAAGSRYMKDEVCDVIWVDRTTLSKLVFRGNSTPGLMWSKVRNFFKSFDPLIHDILFTSLHKVYSAV
jgi:hypothetical protein